MVRILFRTQDLSEVKRYCYSSWLKILENKVSIQDFIFSREVRMGTYRCALPHKRMPIIEGDIRSDKGPPPPGVMVAARRQLEDPNNEAQYQDRIPYVIARGALQERLVDRAVAPEELLDGFVSSPTHVLPQPTIAFFPAKNSLTGRTTSRGS
jgi:DNA polymerase zeta